MLTSKRICNLSTKKWFSFPLLGLLLVPIFGQPSKARPNSDAFCEETKIGTYLIVSQGSKKNIPLGQLQLETWNSDGSLKGTRFLREGKKYNTSHYTGRWKNVDNCSVKINRNDGGMDSQRTGLRVAHTTCSTDIQDSFSGMEEMSQIWGSLFTGGHDFPAMPLTLSHSRIMQ